MHDAGILSSLLQLMDVVDGGLPNKQFLHGKVMDTRTKRMIFVPPELKHGMTKLFQLASESALNVLQLPSIDGVRYGTMCAKIDPIYLCRRGVLLVYHRRARRVITG